MPERVEITSEEMMAIMIALRCMVAEIDDDQDHTALATLVDAEWDQAVWLRSKLVDVALKIRPDVAAEMRARGYAGDEAELFENPHSWTRSH